jgi:hypothetical protein
MKNAMTEYELRTHMTDEPCMNTPCAAEEYVEHQGIRIYSGLTADARHILEQRISSYRAALHRLYADDDNLPRLSYLTSSTITAQGCISGIQFNEETLIKQLPQPTGQILFIGCNFGELSNAAHEPRAAPPAKQSSKGRRPKQRAQPKRIMKGSGKYFGSQITFDIASRENGHVYKIKLFRTGVFQVPHVRSPDMTDLCGPILVLLDYLRPLFGGHITVTDFKAVMRNYKAELTNQDYYVDLQKMNEILATLKEMNGFKNATVPELTHELHIAEITYNVDRHASLLVKFNRPTASDATKQTTVKLIKSGKVNFDGGSNRLEIEELYLIINTIYALYAAEIIVNQKTVFTTQNLAADQNVASADDVSLYDYHLQAAQDDELLASIAADQRAIDNALLLLNEAVSNPLSANKQIQD